MSDEQTHLNTQYTPILLLEENHLLDTMKFSSVVAPLALALAAAPSAYAGPLAYGICQTGEHPSMYAHARVR